MGDTKNFVLFAVLSLAILLGYQTFYAGPKMEAARMEAAEARTEQATEEALAPREIAPEDATTAEVVEHETVLEDAGSVRIVTPELEGSLSLRGARFDDLQLVKHKVTMADDSPNVRLLSPAGTPDAYYARFGWSASGQNPDSVPTDKSIWSADGDTLTPSNPVTLSWENGEGLRFLMKIEVDKEFMFTITQSVENTTDSTLQMAPYGSSAVTASRRPQGFISCTRARLAYSTAHSKRRNTTISKTTVILKSAPPVAGWASQTNTG